MNDEVEVFKVRIKMWDEDAVGYHTWNDLDRALSYRANMALSPGVRWARIYQRVGPRRWLRLL